MSSHDIDLLHYITNSVRNLIWLIGVGMVNGVQSDNNLTLTNGLSRALMLEQPSLHSIVLDMGNLRLNYDSTCANAAKALGPFDNIDDKELVR